MARTPDRTGKTGSDDLARVVRERREELGLTRQELADATGIPYPTIAQIETAYRGASPARLGVIARVLGLDPKDLYEVLAAEGAEEMGSASEVSAPAGRSAGVSWHTNPRFAAALPAAAPMAEGSAPRARTGAPASPSPARTRTPGVVDQILILLQEVPIDRRLDLLTDVQKRVVDDIVQERTAGR